MTEYTFTLRFVLPEAEGDLDQLAERLGSAGCDDALIGVGHRSRVALDFVREADSAREAVFSAIGNARQALPRAALVEATPDLVGATDVAALVGCSRQNIRKLMVGSGSGAPAPLHEGRTAIWHLASVLGWLERKKGYAIDEDLIELSRVTMSVNATIDFLSVDAGEGGAIRALLA